MMKWITPLACVFVLAACASPAPNATMSGDTSTGTSTPSSASGTSDAAGSSGSTGDTSTGTSGATATPDVPPADGGASK